MSGKPLSDALVFFGITGDLAYNKIFPRSGLVRLPLYVPLADSRGRR